jgi:hypothetical protein
VGVVGVVVGAVVVAAVAAAVAVDDAFLFLFEFDGLEDDWCCKRYTYQKRSFGTTQTRSWVGICCNEGL